MNQYVKSIEQQIWEKVFPNEEYSANDYRDWASENEMKAYLLCLEIAKGLQRLYYE